MKLDEALTLRMSFNDLQGEIRVDENGYICLNDLAAYYPNKKIDRWKENKSTIEFIELMEKVLNTHNSGYLNKGDSTHLKKVIISKRGKYNGGTYAHQDLAMEFCMWLSPEFKLTVIQAYRKGSQKKKDWNVKRILASYNYKIMSKSVEDAHDPAKFYHYSNEAKMLNVIVFGKSEKGIRELATEKQLDDIALFEGRNSAYIDLGMNYEERKKVLTDQYKTLSLMRICKDKEIGE